MMQYKSTCGCGCGGPNGCCFSMQRQQRRWDEERREREQRYRWDDERRERELREFLRNYKPFDWEKYKLEHFDANNLKFFDVRMGWCTLEEYNEKSVQKGFLYSSLKNIFIPLQGFLYSLFYNKEKKARKRVFLGISFSCASLFLFYIFRGD